MKGNDNAFINQVVDFYYTTVDKEHPQGNMSTVAEKFKITRAKVNKILITAGVIDSPLHQDIMKLKERGYDTDDIASALGVSAATVKINTPYEKVIYNGEAKSTGASYVEEFRKRERVFLNNVVRSKTDLEKTREVFFANPVNVYMENFMKEQGMIRSDAPVDGMDDIDMTVKMNQEDDPIHLMPYFTEEDGRLFKLHPDVLVLHIELDADLSDVKDLAEIKYESLLCRDSDSAGSSGSVGSSGEQGNPGAQDVKDVKDNHSAKDAKDDHKIYTISRDILVPFDLPLHNLHYAINQAFGFTNSHLHEYTLSSYDLNWFTEGKVSKWEQYVGLVFKNPVRDENIDFWDDDYEGGSPKKWMRSKYTGPVYDKIFEESYWYAQEQMEDVTVKSKSIYDLPREFYLNPLALNEALPVGQIMSDDGQESYADIEDYNKYMEECFGTADEYPTESQMSQPYLYGFAETLNYSYDFGDGWNLTIKAMKDVEYLVKDGRITAEQIKEAMKDVCTLARPVVIAADGLPLVEDVGGGYGFNEFLKGINGLGSSMYDDKKESLAWAKGNGWSGKIGNLKTML